VDFLLWLDMVGFPIETHAILIDVLMDFPMSGLSGLGFYLVDSPNSKTGYDCSMFCDSPQVGG
jgi:hypothetical protein